MNINTIPFVSFLALIATIVLTILAYIFIVPKKETHPFGRLGLFLHNFFNFKFLIIEKILQFIYVLGTIAVISYGFFMIFGFSIYSSSFGTYSTWLAGYGILTLILGPIFIRLIYEGIMLFFILVKNVIEINSKLKSDTEEEDSIFTLPNIKEIFKKEKVEEIVIEETVVENNSSDNE